MLPSRCIPPSRSSTRQCWRIMRRSPAGTPLLAENFCRHVSSGRQLVTPLLKPCRQLTLAQRGARGSLHDAH
eukprot:2455395-Amphidinium_carterae.1